MLLPRSKTECGKEHLEVLERHSAKPTVCGDIGDKNVSGFFLYREASRKDGLSKTGLIFHLLCYLEHGLNLRVTSWGIVQEDNEKIEVVVTHEPRVMEKLLPPGSIWKPAP